MAEFRVGMQIEAEHMQNLFGSHDAYIKQIEEDLNVVITDRNGEVRISGEQAAVNKAAKLVRELVCYRISGGSITGKSAAPLKLTEAKMFFREKMWYMIGNGMCWEAVKQSKSWIRILLRRGK